MIFSISKIDISNTPQSAIESFISLGKNLVSLGLLSSVLQKQRYIISKCAINPFPDMPILGSSNSAAEKDTMSKIWTSGDTII